MGPQIQMPSGPIQDESVVRPEWLAFFSSLQMATYASSRNGSTSVRPTSEFSGRYEGMPFFDRTLGFPVFLKHASSNVWVRYDGTVA